MAKYGKNNYMYDVILPESKEKALRRMAKGVKLGYGEKNVYSSSFNGTILTSPPIQIDTSDFSIEYYGNAYGSGSGAPLLFNRANLGSVSTSTYFQVYGLNLGRNDLNWVTFSVPDGGNIATDSLNFNYSAPDLSTKFHLVITRQGRMINIYIDNTLVASKEQTEIKDLGAFALVILNSSDVGFARVWNYALSAADVSALYNNGDPAGYIVPKSRRLQATPYIRLMAPMTTDGWSSYNAQSIPPTIVDGALAVTYPTETGQGYNNGIWRRLSVNVENECYFLLKFKAKADDDNTRIASFVGVGSGLTYYRHDVIASTSFTEYYAVFKNTRGVPMTSIGFYPIFNTSGNGKFYIKDVSVTSIGLIAEYLPQNLIPTAEGSVVKWLDSAPQLPEENGVLPPLDASVGGYDLAAVGNPKIII